MARRAAERHEKKGVTITDQDREVARERRKTLVNPSYDEVEAALKAIKLCGGCADRDKPKKVNAAGKCMMCSGAGVIRDHDQRRWAAEFVLSRADPAPKSVEMFVDDHRDKEAMLKDIANLPDEKVDALLAELGIQVAE